MGYIVLKSDDGPEYIGHENNDFINKFINKHYKDSVGIPGITEHAPEPLCILLLTSFWGLNKKFVTMG